LHAEDAWEWAERIDRKGGGDLDRDGWKWDVDTTAADGGSGNKNGGRERGDARAIAAWRNRSGEKGGKNEGSKADMIRGSWNTRADVVDKREKTRNEGKEGGPEACEVGNGQTRMGEGWGGDREERGAGGVFEGDQESKKHENWKRPQLWKKNGGRGKDMNKPPEKVPVTRDETGENFVEEEKVEAKLPNPAAAGSSGEESVARPTGYLDDRTMEPGDEGGGEKELSEEKHNDVRKGADQPVGDESGHKERGRDEQEAF
jgi:hypothetical protein